MKYSVLGDGVAMSERLEDGNKKYSGRLMISDETLEQPGVAEAFLMRLVDFVSVKGRDSPMPLWQIICNIAEETKDRRRLADTHTRALRCYENREFAKAISL